MTHYDNGDAALFVLAMVLGVLCATSPRTVLWVLSYGGRIRHQRPEWPIRFLRITGALACLGGLVGLAQWFIG